MEDNEIDSLVDNYFSSIKTEKAGKHSFGSNSSKIKDGNKDDIYSDLDKKLDNDNDNDDNDNNDDNDDDDDDDSDNSNSNDSNSDDSNSDESDSSDEELSDQHSNSKSSLKSKKDKDNKKNYVKMMKRDVDKIYSKAVNEKKESDKKL